jgi:hypothetical protein
MAAMTKIRKIGIVNHRHSLLVRLISVLSSLIFCLMPAGLSAQTNKFREDDFWVSESPEVNAVIRPGEIYLVLRKKNDFVNIPLRARVFLSENYGDRLEISHLCKQTGKRLSMVYTRPLAVGGHKLIVETTGLNGEHSEIQIPFLVGSPEESLIFENKNYPLVKGTGIPIAKPRLFKVEGTLQVTSLNYRLTGSQPELRQEPSGTHETDLQAKITYRNFSIPVRLFLTSTDSQNIQGRNRFQMGVEHRAFKIMAGDIYPNYDRLVLGGIRTRGLGAEVKLMRKKLILSGVLGHVQEAIEGRVIRYEPGNMVLPINLQPDSTFIRRGTYSRYLGSFALTFGKQRDRNQLTLIFLKSKDDTSSIRYGERPKDNVVAGLDFDLTRPDQTLQWKAGFAIGMTTNDITQPLLTKELLKEEYKVDVDRNFKNWAWLLIFNPSTTPLKPETGVSMAWFSNIRFRVLKHTVTLDARQTGPQYQSFGNPFIRTDIMTLSLSEAGQYFRQKLSVQNTLQFNEDNLAQTQFSTRRTGVFSSTIGFNPGPKKPFLNGGIRVFERSVRFRGQNKFLSSDELITLFLSSGFQIERNGFSHSLSLGGSWFSRTGRQEFNNNKSWSAFASFSSTPGIPLRLHVTYSYMELVQGALLFQNLQHNLGGSAGWEFKKLKLTAGVRVNQSLVEASQGILPNLRKGQEFFLTWRPKDAFDLRLTAGKARFQESGTAGKNYQEQFIRFNGQYRFGT